MEYIDKHNPTYRSRGIDLVKRFLDQAWDETAGAYQACTFENLRSFEQHAIFPLLAQEQDYHCCYCMRTIAYREDELSDLEPARVSRNVTIEHVLPFKAKVEDAQYYLNLPEFTDKEVCYMPESEVAVRNQSLNTPPYPHFCAYDNLVLSCAGDIPDSVNNDSISNMHMCCNNKRGSSPIVPLFYIRDIASQMTYESDGYIAYDEERYRETIQYLNLCAPTLRLMRRAWAQIAKAEIKLDRVYNVTTDQDKKDLFDDALLDTSDKTTLLNETYWKVFLTYSWFHGYFANQKAA